MVRAKFQVTEVAELSWGSKRITLTPQYDTITLTPQYDTSIEEDRRYAKATPSGRIELQVDNPPAAEALALSKYFYVDFTPVE